MNEMIEEKEVLKRMTVYLEEDQIDALEEIAQRYTKTLGQRWSKSAVIRLAVSDFLTKIGKIT